jgi:hypothetical protein
VNLKRFIGTVAETCPSRLTTCYTRGFRQPSPKMTMTQDVLARTVEITSLKYRGSDYGD